MASPNRYRQRKDANQSDLVKDLIAVGCSVYVMHAPCDIMVGYRGINWLFEVKTDEKKKLTKAQVAFRGTWRGQFDRIETAEQAMRKMGVLQ